MTVRRKDDSTVPSTFTLFTGDDSTAGTMMIINRLTPNDPYMSRTAPLTSKRCILYIYSTNI